MKFKSTGKSGSVYIHEKRSNPVERKKRNFV